jgi:hypothetical protein
MEEIGGMKVSCLTVSFLILERICEVASIGVLRRGLINFLDIVNLTHIVDELSPLICNLSGEKGEIEQRSMG